MKLNKKTTRDELRNLAEQLPEDTYLANTKKAMQTFNRIRVLSYKVNHYKRLKKAFERYGEEGVRHYLKKYEVV